MSPEKAHVSINVSDLGKAVEFYRHFLGLEPTKHYKDYAKFELTDPPLVLSLEPVYHRATDSFNHLGIRLEQREQVIALHQRLKESGLVADYEDDVECCYSRQTKFWLADPDKNLWEIYALTGELPRRGGLSASEALAARDRHGGQTTFEHRLGDTLSHPWPVESGTVDEVRLRGTFNTPRPPEEKARLLAEAFRILKPGGHLLIHGLVSDRAHPEGFPRLPGPAALVKDTPLEAAPLAWVREAGFTGLYVQKLGEGANFKHDGIQMRELLLVAYKPALADPEEEVHHVTYRGPFREAVDDLGIRYPRGERVAVDAATVARLRQGPLADQLFFLKGTAS